MQLRVASLSMALVLALSLSTTSATSNSHFASHRLESVQVEDVSPISPLHIEQPQAVIRHHKFNHNHSSQRIRAHIPLRRQDDASSHLPTAPSTSSLPDQEAKKTIGDIKSKTLDQTSLSTLPSQSSNPQPTVTLPETPSVTKPTASPTLSSITILDDGTHASSTVIQLLQAPQPQPPSLSNPSFQPPSITLPQLQVPSISLPSVSISLPGLNAPHPPQGPPAPPQGASLVQFRPSLRSKASVPMFVSDAWNSKSEAPMSMEEVNGLLSKSTSGFKPQSLKSASSEEKNRGGKGPNIISNQESKGSKKLGKTHQKTTTSSSHLKPQHKPSKNKSKSRNPAHESRSQKLDISPSITSAYISIHGRDRNAPQAFEDVYKALKSGGVSLDGKDASSVVVAPNFFIASDAKAKPGTSFFNKSRNLWWPAEGHEDGPFGLFDGADASGPRNQLLLAQISTFDVLDQLVAQFSNLAIYPDMKNITIAGHSAGAEMVQRWSAIGSYSLPSSDEGLGKSDRIHLRIIIANSPSSVYFTSDRPDNPNGATRVPSRSHKSGSISNTGCLFDHWRYGFNGKQPRYVELKLAQVGGLATAIEAKGRLLFSQWIRKDIVRLIGTLDTENRASGGDRSCAVRTQGGHNRRDRGYAFWAYQTLLSGSDEDVTEFYGYQNLSQSVVPIPNISHASQHRLGIVSGVGHVAKRMYESPIGLSALLDKTVLEGPRPPPMPDSGSGSGSNVAGGRKKHGGSYAPKKPKIPINLKDLNGNSASSISNHSQSFHVSILASTLLLLLFLTL